MERIMNLGEKIYFLTYGKPRYKLEISKMLYGVESKAIYPEIKKLEKNNWIKKLESTPEMPVFHDVLFKTRYLDLFKDDSLVRDGRAKTRQYYFAQIKPLFDSICISLKEQNIALDVEEEKKLIKFLDSFWFRHSILQLERFVVDQHKRQYGFFVVKASLSHLCMFRSYLEKVIRNTAPDTSEDGIEKFMELLRDGIEKDESIPPDKKIDAEVMKLGLPLQEKLTHLDYYTTLMFNEYFDLLLQYVGDIYDLPLIKKKAKYHLRM